MQLRANRAPTLRVAANKVPLGLLVPKALAALAGQAFVGLEQLNSLLGLAAF